jgi:hypothetical protein
MKGGPLFDVAVCQRTAILKLLIAKDDALDCKGSALCLFNLLLDTEDDI